LRSIACGKAEHAIIGGEKDVSRRLLGTREMKCIVGAKPYRFQYNGTCDRGVRQRDCVMCPIEHIPDTGPSFMTWRLADSFLHDGTTDPLPCTDVAASQDQENRFSFQPDAVLALIVKRAV
jgi:hypothetical protein